MFERETEKERISKLHLVSSSSKIWNQLVIFLLIGLLPIIFPKAAAIQNQEIVFYNLVLALTTSVAYELWSNWLRQNGRETKIITTLQILTSVVLLTHFLHYFGRINGPLFILYLLTVLESSLNLNVSLPNYVVGTMVVALISEFVFLLKNGDLTLDFMTGIGLAVRLASLMFMRGYGTTLATAIIEEQNEKLKTQKLALDLQEAVNKEEEKGEELAKTVNQLERLNKKLIELDRMKDEFVSIASHELRTPMTSINSYIWMVLHGKSGKVSKKQRFYLERAAISTQRLINLVEDMLTVSRIEGGRLELDLQAEDIVVLAETVAEELSLKAKEKKISLVLKKPKNKLPLVKMDKARIHEVIVNLLGNAIKFTEPKGKITVSFKKRGKKLRVMITDTGRGIPRADQGKLFKKFSRLERSFATIAETGGTGLGLYICKQLVDLHRGKIGVISKLSKGSTFYFELRIFEKKGGQNEKNSLG